MVDLVVAIPVIMPTLSKIIPIAAFALFGAVAFAAEGAEAPSDTRSLRRTSVVEVFENWKDSVVFVTGPIVRTDKRSPAEFFATGGPKENTVGTGFAIHESGYVVTNAHGVEKTAAPVVVFADGKGSPAEPVAVLHDQDLALLKVEGRRPLKPVRLARSGDLMIGETVIVIANPHGLRNTCTCGVLSAAGRATHLADVPGVTLQDMIQSDAGINPGSSGGPWFNVAGEVMGMTASMKKDAENIAFAVSATTLRKMLPRMLDVERRYRIATGMEVAADGACEIKAVEPDSPAVQAGIHLGDILAQVSDRPIPTGLDFHLALVGRKAGESLAIAIIRDGKRLKGSLTLGGRPQLDVKAVLQQKLGISAAPLEQTKAKAMGLRVPRGLLITSIASSLYGKVDHPPQPGDVLARIGFVHPHTPEHAAELVENLQPGQAVDLVFLRRKDSTATRIDVHLVLPSAVPSP